MKISEGYNWAWHFIIIDILFVLLCIFMLHITTVIYYILWTVVSFLSFLFFLKQKDNLRNNSNALIIIFALHAFFVYMGWSAVKFNIDDDFEIAIGEFIKKDGSEYIYKIQYVNGTSAYIDVDIDYNLKKNNPFFHRIRQTVLLRTNPGQILEWMPNANQLKDYKYAVSCKNHFYSEEIGVNSYAYAKDYPKLYFNNFGLDIVYKAKVVSNYTNRCKVNYVNYFGELIETDIYCNVPNTTDSLLIYVKIKPDTNPVTNYLDTTFSKTKIKSFAVNFADTLIPIEVVLKEIPQIKDLLSTKYNEPSNNNLFVAIGYLFKFHTYPNGHGARSYSPVYITQNSEGKLVTIDIDDIVSSDSDYKDSICLINAYNNTIIKKTVSQSDYQKYKYPVNISFNGNEIGNDSYSYAKIEPYNFIKHFGLNFCYLAEVTSVSEKEIINEIQLTFKDTVGNICIETILTNLPNEKSRKLIIFKKNGKYFPAEHEFQTEFYFEKIKDGFGYLFKDTILTKQELIKNIPTLINNTVINQ
ncbi:MAG: hypothetical protein J6Z01_02285 [Bacteroidales bacterium]|nr:hypothetical protein [Bacteroidales bacterium]